MKTLQELGACRQGLAFAPQFPTLQAAWAESASTATFPPMNPQTEIDLLRSQLSDARKQLEADSATIAKLSADKRELVSALRKYRDGVVLALR